MLTYCTMFLAVFSICLCYTEPKKESCSAAVLWYKLFMLIVLYVVLEAVNEDGLRQAARSSGCLGERGCLRHKVSSSFHWYLCHPPHWLANVTSFMLPVTEVWEKCSRMTQPFLLIESWKGRVVFRVWCHGLEGLGSVTWPVIWSFSALNTLKSASKVDISWELCWLSKRNLAVALNYSLPACKWTSSNFIKAKQMVGVSAPYYLQQLNLKSVIQQLGIYLNAV